MIDHGRFSIYSRPKNNVGNDEGMDGALTTARVEGGRPATKLVRCKSWPGGGAELARREVAILGYGFKIGYG